MKITLLAVGSKMPRWVDDAFGDYAKRFGRDIQFELKEIKPEKRGGGVTAEKALPPNTSASWPPFRRAASWSSWTSAARTGPRYSWRAP
jgi:23S rRNA (pseudouridine1915-N3)-methyltransferase